VVVDVPWQNVYRVWDEVSEESSFILVIPELPDNAM